MNNLLKILKYAKPYWGFLILAGASMLIITGINLVTPWLVTELIGILKNNLSADNALNTIAKLAVTLAFAYIIRAVFTFINRYYSHVAAWNLVSDMKIRVYNHLQNLSLKYYHDKQTGQLMSRTANDPATFEVLIAHAVPDLIINVLIFLGVAVILFIMNPALAAFTLIPVPFMAVLGMMFSKKILPSFRKAQETLAEFNAVLQDNLSGIKEIQAFNQQQREKGRVSKGARDHAKAILHALKLSAFFHPSVEFFSSLGTVIVVGLGGTMAFKGKMPMEDVVGFILYLGMFYQPIATLSRVMEDIQQATAGAERVFEVLSEEPDVKEAKNPLVLKDVKGHITFEHVSFKYEDSNDVLKDVSFDILPGEMVAFVGPTGVGKTTLVSLIPRFYDPVAGRILIDGNDIRDYSLFSLRNQISIVLQDVFLFNGTIAENIAYGAKNPSFDDIVSSAKTANAHEFISSLPDGYDTYIGERGVKLSGGQKQRLSIARAILRDCPILILDEATASVDVETEQKIQDAINKLIENRTILVIAHRLSTVKKANKIIVLDEGRIAEQGSHDELIRKNGLYHRLCQVQFSEKALV